MALTAQPLKQHLIDPDICIRCNTCEETCPVHAVTHDDNNYVVKADVCESCMKCITPCPTGAIDNWRVVSRPYTIEEQFAWKELPPPDKTAPEATPAHAEALEDDVSELLDHAHKGNGGSPRPPPSANKPTINLYNRGRPACAKVVGNFRLTAPEADHDIRHIILDFGSLSLPVLEGQSLGIIPRGVDANGAPHKVRLYSISSPRDGEKLNANNVAFTVKRVPGGVCSNYFCNLERGATIDVTGPFGATFLMPNEPSANIIMICTGTGSAPFRAFIERRRRAMPQASGTLQLFFGARCPGELPYFGPLQKLPTTLLSQHLCFSRVPDQPKTYVQDAIRRESEMVGSLLQSPSTHVFVCGLKGMEGGVEDALDDVCRARSLDWQALRGAMQAEGRLQMETY
jgi:benzoyl-CoA 2,3-epoxidase subunit A